MYSSKFAFTLVELIVSVSILAILTSVGFYAYTDNISVARDSVRETNISSYSSQLALHKRERGAYPFPGERFNLTNGTAIVAYQGKMDNTVSLSNATELLLDPSLDIPYVYSTSRNRQEYQLAASLENNDQPYALLKGDYRSVSKDILPNIIIARDSNSDVDISISTNANLFVFDTLGNNLVYDFITGTPISNNSKTISEQIQEAGKDYWQNSDYRSCEEINTARKNITASGSSNQYQILSSTGVLIDTSCDGIL